MRRLAFVALLALICSPALAQEHPRTPEDRGVSAREAPDLWLATREGFRPWTVRSVHLHEAVSDLPSLSVEAEYEGGAISADGLLGEPITVGVREGPTSFRHVHGYVRHARVASMGDRTSVSFDVTSSLWLMVDAEQRRAWVDRAPLDVVAELAAAHPTVQLRVDVRRPPARRPLIVQHRETDLDVMRRLLAEEGLFFRIEHAPHGHVVVITDRAPAPTIEVRGVSDAGPVVHWERYDRLAPTVEILESAMPGVPTVTRRHGSPRAIGSLVSRRTLRFASRAAGQRMGGSDPVLFTASFRGRAPAAGATLTVRGMDDRSDDGRYVALSSTFHAMAYEGSFEQQATVTLVRENTPFVVAPQLAPAYGAESVVVRGSADTNGRVPVRFAWAEVDIPVRVAGDAPPAGAQALVFFDGGHPDQPILLGRSTVAAPTGAP